MVSISLRASLVADAAASALRAHAAEAYSNIPANYYPGGYFVSGSVPQDLAYKFTSGITGNLSGFQVAMTNFGVTGQQPFILDLYADNTGQLGSLLDSYSGLTTGISYDGTSTALSNVVASGLTLTGGTSYWLAAHSTSDLVLNWSTAR